MTTPALLTQPATLPEVGNVRLGTVMWRWLAVVAVAGNVAFNYLYSRVGAGLDMKTVSDEYASPITPAPYAFAIWGLIYAALIAYAIVELRPGQRRIAAYDRLAPLVVAANALATAWIIAFTHLHVGASLGIMTVLLAVAAVLYARANRERVRARLPALRIPFALLFGWIMVAWLADLGATMAAAGVPMSVHLAAILAVAAAGTAIAIAIPNHDPALLLTVAWALIAVAARGIHLVCAIALVAGIACALVGVGLLALRVWIPTTSRGARI